MPCGENPKVGARNLHLKLERVPAGGPLEWPDIVAIDVPVLALIEDAKRIPELGGRKGRFAWEASADPPRIIVCSEFDLDSSRWAQEHRSRPKVRYVTRPLTGADGPFDLVVAIEVVEHVRAFRPS